MSKKSSQAFPFESQQHFKDFPRGHCTEDFMRKQGSFRPRAQLSFHKSASNFGSVWVSFLHHNHLMGTTVMPLRFASVQLIFLYSPISFTQRITSFFPARTRSPGSSELCDRQIHRPTARLTHFSGRRRVRSVMDLHQPSSNFFLTKSSKCCVHKLWCTRRSHFGQSSTQHDVSVKKWFDVLNISCPKLEPVPSNSSSTLLASTQTC